MYIAQGCLAQDLTLSCPGSGEILITSADFGVYYLECTSTCCPPNPVYDCFVDVESVAPNFYNFMKSECDTLNTCTFEYTGYVVDECVTGYVADFMQVFYDCISEDNTGPVGFTAEVIDSYTVNAYEVIDFSRIF